MIIQFHVNNYIYIPEVLIIVHDKWGIYNNMNLDEIESNLSYKNFELC